MRSIDAFPETVAEMPREKAAIRIDPGTLVGEVSPFFLGFNVEDLNHQLYPGLYAQMLSDESFEDEPMVDLPAGWDWHAEPINADTPKAVEEMLGGRTRSSGSSFLHTNRTQRSAYSVSSALNRG